MDGKKTFKVYLVHSMQDRRLLEYVTEPQALVDCLVQFSELWSDKN
jgi:hypothetical protein